MRFWLLITYCVIASLLGCASNKPQIVLVKSRFASDDAMLTEATYQCQQRYGLNAMRWFPDSFDTEKFICN
jgi:hypothetical protein